MVAISLVSCKTAEQGLAIPQEPLEECVYKGGRTEFSVWAPTAEAAQLKLYRKLKKDGHKRIYYIGAEGMIGDDGEATVDAIHFTDLGAMRYVEHVLPTIRKALKYAN